MKIKEAVALINETDSFVAKHKNDCLFVFSVGEESQFIEFNDDQTTFLGNADFSVGEIGYGVNPEELLEVLEIIRELVETPVKERFPEKSYLLVAKRKPDRPGLPKYVKAMATGVNEFNFYLTDDKNEAEIYKESVLEGIKKREPSLAPAIDAMKEPAEDKDNEN